MSTKQNKAQARYQTQLNKDAIAMMASDDRANINRFLDEYCENGGAGIDVECARLIGERGLRETIDYYVSEDATEDYNDAAYRFVLAIQAYLACCTRLGWIKFVTFRV